MNGLTGAAETGGCLEAASWAWGQQDNSLASAALVQAGPDLDCSLCYMPLPLLLASLLLLLGVPGRLLYAAAFVLLLVTG